MRVLKLLLPVVILGFTVFLTSCQSPGSPAGLSRAEKLYTARDVARMFPFIYVSEPLTYGLACQIVEHDVTLVCEGLVAAPEGFDHKLCRPGARVCLEALGTPSAPPTPSPAPVSPSI